ncbi:ISxac2 transposase [Xanthomonas citri pv. aurantifolii str. ICPB 10535]|nr:ISxac2 transposase [Xanthomonas citri pv. aurantifolii str. ICPB 10535]
MPGWMCSTRMPCRCAQDSNAPLMYSGPLSQRITAGLPRHSMICSSDRITRADGSDRSTSIPSPSRLKSSSTLNSRKLRPSANWSCMKSIDPDLVDGLGHRQRLGPLTHQPLLRLDPQVQLQLAVDPVDPLVIPAKALHVAQVQVAQAKAPVAMGGRQADQPVGDPGVLLAGLGLVAEAGLAHREGLAGVADVRAPARDCRLGHLASLRWPHHFFASASFSRSVLSCASAYIFLSRRFSSSSSFMRATMDTSMPPNLLRHL